MQSWSCRRSSGKHNVAGTIIEHAILSRTTTCRARTSKELDPAMSTITHTDPISAASITDGTWRLDPTRSSVEFHVRHFWGLISVKGDFSAYEGTLDLSATPAVELTIEADSLDTEHVKRDTHLRSEDFFDVERHPQVRFVSDSARLDGGALHVRGQLHAGGQQIPLEL